MISTTGPIAKSCDLISSGQWLDQLAGRRTGLADEEPVELPRQEDRGLRAIEHDADDVGRPPRAGLAEEGFGSVVDLRGVMDEARRLLETALGILSHPAGECTGGLADIAFRVIPGAQGEKLQKLASEVLVGTCLLAGSPIEPDEHRRVGDDRLRGVAAKLPRA